MTNYNYLPELVQKLEKIKSWNSFANSLVMQFQRKNYLSEKQISSAQNMLNKMADNNIKRESIKKSFDATKIEELFQTAIGNGLKRPKFHCGEVVLSLASEQSVNKGAVYVKHKMVNEYGDKEKTYIGKIMDNVFMPILKASQKSIDAVMEIALNPLESAIKHGKMSNHCSMCDRELTDDRSIQNGYGKKCADNYGFPY